MTRFWIFTFALLLVMLLLFSLAQSLQLPFLAEDTSFLLSQKKWVAGLAGIGLLVVDVVAPVPSSIIMVANGILFGPVWGTLLSVVGGMGAALVGYWIGARGERVGKRWLGDESLTRANDFFRQYGMMAVIVSRPIPILAEAVSIIAGISRMPVGRFFPATLLGLLPTAIIYAVAGAYSVNLQSGLYVFLAVMLLAGVVWVMGRRVMKSKNRMFVLWSVPATPIRAVDERVLPFTPDQIWLVLADLENYPSWYPRSLNLKLLSANANGIGSEVEIRPRGGRAIRCRVESLEPPRRMRTRYPGDFIVGTGEWRLDAAPGGTRVTYEIDVVAIGWLAAVIGRVLPLSPIHSKAMREVLESLERETGRRVQVIKTF